MEQLKSSVKDIATVAKLKKLTTYIKNNENGIIIELLFVVNHGIVIGEKLNLIFIKLLLNALYTYK